MGTTWRDVHTNGSETISHYSRDASRGQRPSWRLHRKEHFPMHAPNAHIAQILQQGIGNWPN
jgi:hypothetical protein